MPRVVFLVQSVRAFVSDELIDGGVPIMGMNVHSNGSPYGWNVTIKIII